MQRNTTLAILLVLTAFFAVAAPLRAEEDELHPPKSFQLHPAPRPVGDLRFLDQKGAVASLRAFQGHIVLVALWATWCPSCHEEMTTLDYLQNALGSEGLTVLPIATDRKGLMLVAPFYRQNDIHTLPMFFDPAQTMAKALEVTRLPTAVILTRDGWELGRVEGWKNWMDPQMLVFLRDLLHRP